VSDDDTHDPDDYPRRKTFPVKLSAYFTAGLFEQIDYCEEHSRPSGGKSTAEQKDMRAFTALECAGELVDAMAGWAIDHTVGLALNGRQWVPLQPPAVQLHPEYVASRAAVDDHVHEKNGGAQRSFKNLDPVVCRKIFLGLLKSNPGGFPVEIQEMMVEALEALEYSETLPILRPAESDRKRKLRELRLQLKAVVFVEYRVARGMTKYKAQDAVGEAYGQSGTTVRLWEARLRTELGQLEVSRNIAFALSAAASDQKGSKKVGMNSSRRFGDEALQETGAKYQEVLRES
jgi:hypothetical protein